MKDNLMKFCYEIPWFFNETDDITIYSIDISYSEDFIQIYSNLYNLLIKADCQLIELERDNKISKFYLYTWTNSNGEKSGWLCKISEDEILLNVSKEYYALIKNIGGIQESYSEIIDEVQRFTDNQNFLFIESECRQGLGDWEEYYLDLCKEENKQPIDTKNLLRIVEEANGNETFLNLKTNEILLFATDHDFEYVEIMKNQPEYTFHKIKKGNNIIDYVETLAKQWNFVLE